MDPITIAAIMAGLGLIKGQGERGAAQAKNAAAIEQTRYSPWTKMGKGETEDLPTPISNALAGGLSGYTLGTNIKTAEDWQDKLKKSAWFSDPGPAPLVAPLAPQAVMPSYAASPILGAPGYAQMLGGR